MSKHLILFVDINGTIIMDNHSNSKTPVQAIREIIATDIKAKWDSSLETELSYRDYVDTILHPGKEVDENLKLARLHQYSHVLEEARKVSYEIYQQAVDLENTVKKNFIINNVIMDSFIAAIDFLNKNNISFTLILRSFGPDLLATMEELQQRANLDFTHFYNLAPLELSQDEKYGLFTAIKPNAHGAWHDNYDFWNQDRDAYRYGKPYFLDLNNPDKIAIFWDDNIKLQTADKTKHIINANILNAPIPADCDYEIYQQCLQDALLRLGLLIQVDTPKAAEENYFINGIKKALDFDMQSLKVYLPQIHKKALALTQLRSQSYSVKHNFFQPNNPENETIFKESSHQTSLRLN